MNHWNYPLVFSFLSCKLRRTLKCFERRYWGKSHHIYEEKNCHVVPVTNDWFTLTDIFFYVFLLLLWKLNIIKNRLILGMFANIVGKWARRMWPSKIKYKGPSISLDKYVGTMENCIFFTCHLNIQLVYFLGNFFFLH